MESPPEENLGSLKISDTEVNLITTPPSSDISPKKSIQLGVVQSSSGVRTSPSNLSLSKKSRWDQAPGSGENEGESKEANNQPNNQEESNIKNLIKKFEVISGSSKLDVQKSEEVSSTKPGRVKLVRTNFAKPENPIKTSISSEKVDIEIIKAEETDKMIIAESPEMPQKDVIPVSSSKALQIISSNYDSPSDESSQEAESSTQSETTSKGTCASPDKAPKGNSHDDTEERIGNMLSSSLNLKDESGPKPKEIESSLSLKNESEPKSDDIEVENKNHDLVSSKKGDLGQNNLVKESSTEQTLTVNVVESELSAKCSEMEVERVEKGKDSSDTVTLKEENSETSADENEKISFDEKISDDVEHLSQSSGLLNQNILSNESKNQCDSEIPQNLDIESKTFNINPVSEKTDIVKSVVTEADSKPAQIEDFELAIDNQIKKDRVKDESSVSMSEHINTVNETDDSNVNTASTLPLDSKECSDVNITIDEKPSDKALPGESSSLYEDVHDFVIITEADLEGYDVGIESTSASILRDEVIDSSKLETINTDNLKDESFVHPRSKNEDGSEVSENTESLKSSEHKECIDRTPTENIKSLEKTETELDGIFGEDSACDKPENGKDKSQSYSDGVDAKMEQIFSENPGSLSEVTCSPEQKNEADLIVVPKENVSSEDDLTLGDSSPKQEDSEIVLETNDSLLQLLQSGGSPKADICQKPKGLGIEMEVEPVEKLEKSKTEYIVQTVSETPSKQNDSGKKSFLGEENIKAPTENLEVNFLNIEDVKTEQTCSEDKSIRLMKEGSNLQYSPENVISEDEAVKDDKSDMVLSKKDLDLKPCNISNDQISVDFVKNSGMQNTSKDYSFDIKSVESKNSSKGLEQSIPESSKQIKTDRDEGIEGDRQLLEKATAGEEKSEIIIEEMEDVQLTDICKDSPTSLKTKTDGDAGIEGDRQPSEIATAGEKKSEIIIEEMEDVQITDICKDSPTDLEANVFKGEYSANISDKVPESSTDVVKAKVDRIEDSVDFKNPEVKDSEMQSLEVEDIIPVEINNDEKKPFECIQAKNVCESSDIPAKAKELDGEIKETNTEEDATSMYCVDDINPNTTNAKMCEEEISNLNLTIKPDKNFTILKSPENKIIHEKDSPGSSHQKDTLNESKELPLEGDLLAADTKNVDVDSKQSSKEEGGSIEVSQQETIERSIDMLFEMPNSEQPLKTSTVCPVSSSKDIRLDVSSETKKMFSEEIHKEMLKLSPEHKAQCEVETIDLPAPGRLSPIKESGNQDILKLKNDATAVSGSCEVAKESSIVDDKDKDCEESVEFDIEKEIVKTSEDSDIATIQAIDSFLEGDNVDIKENISESNSKCGNLTVDQSQTEIIADEDSNNFSNTANERTNAEDVMLGVEGDLDLDNSLTYDSKKLDLSPSSEPSISEENYDLPGDSYDKESLVKEQENTNILSDVLDDVEANIKEGDAELLEVPKVNEVEELSLAKTTAFSECPKDQQVFDKGRLAHKDIELEINKAAKCDIDSSLIKTQPVQCNSKTELEICKDKINQGSSRTEDTEIENSSLLHKPDDLETEQPKDITRPSIKYSSDAVIESKQVQRLEEYSNKDSLEKNVEKSESKITKEIYQSASNELPVKLSESKDVDLDFESLIPSSTVLSKEKIVLDSTIKDAKGETVEGDQGHLENVSKEPSFNTKPDVRQKSNESLTEEFNSCKTKASSTGKEKELEESKSSTLKHTSNIADQVSSVDISSNNDIECDIKLSKKLCQENEEIHHVSVEQDNSILEVNKSNQLEKPASNKVELKSSEEHIILKADISTKEKLIIPTIPNQTLESHSFNKGNIHNKDEDVCPSISSNLATEALSSDESMTTEKNTMGKSTDDSQPSIKNDSSMSVQKVSLDTPQPETCLNKEHVESHSSDDTINTTQVSNVNIDTKSMSNVETESKSNSADFGNQNPTEAVSDQAAKLPKAAVAKEIPAPVRVSARQKQRQAAAAAALAAKEKAEATKSPGQGAVVKKGSAQDKPADKRSKKSLSPTKELQIKISGKSQESGKQSPLSSQKSPKIVESKINLQISPKKNSKEVGQDKLEPITLKLSKEENPVIVRSSSLSPKKNASPHSPQGKTLGYTLKIGKDSTTIIPKDSTPSPTRRESSPGSGGSKADLSGKVGYLIKDTGLTITPVAPAETQEQKLSKITLKLSKAGGHPEIKQENKSETWKAIRKLGEIDIVPVEGKSPTETAKRKDKSEEGSPEKKIKLADVTMEPSTSSGVSKLQGLLTQAPLNQSDSSEDGKFIGFGSPSEKVSPSQQQQQSYDIGMIRHDDSPQPPRKRGRPRKITSPDDIVHSVSVPHTLPSGLTAKDILAASLQHQSLQQHVHPSYQSPQSYQPPEDVDSSQPMVPLFDLFEETFMEPSPPTIFPDQVQPSTDIIMRSARGRPIGRSRRPRGSGLMRGHERGGPRGRPRGSRGLKRILEEMEAMSFPDPDQPITLENIDAEMGPRMAEHAASELTMALLRKSIEGKKEILEKKARKSDGSDEGNGDLDAQVREMKEKIEAAYQAELKSPSKEGRKRTPEKLEEKSPIKKSPPGLIPIQKQEDRRKSAEGKEAVKRKLSEDKSEEGQSQAVKRKSADEKLENVIPDEGSTEESTKEDAPMEVDQPATSEEPSEEKEIKTEPEPPPKPVKPRPRSKAEIKRIKREKDRLRREAKKLAALEALKAPPPNPCEEDTRMSASDPNGEGIDGEGLGIKKNRMEVGDPEGKEFTVEQIAEYQWPLQGGELYMIQEQISTWLGVKSFQRKYPDLKRRRVEMEERTYLCDSGLVAESMCDLGLTAVSSSEVLDIMFQDFPDQYEELRKHMREKQARELINKQKERKKFEQTLSKSDLKEHAIQSLASWNANLNKSRNETRKCHLDLQTWTIQYPRSKAAKMTRPTGKLGGYPVALISGQYADYYKRYTAAELRYFPVNTVLYGPLQPNEMHSMGGSDGSQSESEDSSSSDGTSDSSSEGEGEGTEEEEKEKERECKTCGSKKANEAMLQCSQCSHNNTTVTVWA